MPVATVPVLAVTLICAMMLSNCSPPRVPCAFTLACASKLPDVATASVRVKDSNWSSGMRNGVA
eukprot:12925474-Prorocentrum_lima.AAC.1